VIILAFPNAVDVYRATIPKIIKWVGDCDIHCLVECLCLFCSPTMMPSSPVVSLSSDTINQVCRESVTVPDLMDLWSSWQHSVEPETWPYNSTEQWFVYCVNGCNIYQLFGDCSLLYVELYVYKCIPPHTDTYSILTAIFPRWNWASMFDFFFHLFWRRTFWIICIDFYGWMPFLSSNQQPCVGPWCK